MDNLKQVVALSAALKKEEEWTETLWACYESLKGEIGEDPHKIGELTTLIAETYQLLKHHFESRGVPLDKGLVIIDTIMGSLLDIRTRQLRESTSIVGTSESN